MVLIKLKWLAKISEGKTTEFADQFNEIVLVINEVPVLLIEILVVHLRCSEV